MQAVTHSARRRPPSPSLARPPPHRPPPRATSCGKVVFVVWARGSWCSLGRLWHCLGTPPLSLSSPGRLPSSLSYPSPFPSLPFHIPVFVRILSLSSFPFPSPSSPHLLPPPRSSPFPLPLTLLISSPSPPRPPSRPQHNTNPERPQQHPSQTMGNDLLAPPARRTTPSSSHRR